MKKCFSYCRKFSFLWKLYFVDVELKEKKKKKHAMLVISVYLYNKKIVERYVETILYM